MKNEIRYTVSMAILLILPFTNNCFASAEIVTYPPPPGLITSPDFTLMAEDRQVWVERIGSKLKTCDYTLYGSREMEELNVANFSCSGEVKIVIRANANIDSFVIRPKSRNIRATVNGSEISFTINGPQKLYVEINNLPHLAIFANPLEINPPKKGDPGVIYYGPGVHNPGKIYLVSNMTMYIAGGAAVNSDIFGKDLRNVTIAGRGILQGKIEVSGSSGFNVSGIFIRNTKGWTNTLTDCQNSSYRNVKVFSYEAIYSVDGINPVSCTNFTIDDCFMRCRDDCVAIKSGDYKLRVDSIFVSNCVMVGWACSDGITIGYELNGGPVENIFIKNCDILYARGDGRTQGHSAFSIVCDGPAMVRNIHFEDIRVENQVEFKNLELIVTDGSFYGTDPPGHIKGVFMKNVLWENKTKPFIIRGYSPDNLAEDIVFENCRVGDKVLKSIGDADIRINSFARNIQFRP
jgi:polygalacturonase